MSYSNLGQTISNKCNFGQQVSKQLPRITHFAKQKSNIILIRNCGASPPKNGADPFDFLVRDFGAMGCEHIPGEQS